MAKVKVENGTVNPILMQQAQIPRFALSEEDEGPNEDKCSVQESDAIFH